jgi:hypothetical protein
VVQHEEVNKGDMSYTCVIDEKDGVIFQSNMYSKTETELASWGYNCRIVEDRISEVITECDNYEGDIPEKLHLTMEYKIKEEDLTIHNMYNIDSLNCNIVMADIRDDNPKNWNVINSEEILTYDDNTTDNTRSDIIQIRKYLVEIYTEHNPKCLSKIDCMLDKYKGREHRLLQKVYKKYIG